MVGCAIAGVFAILEVLYGTRQSAKDCHKTWLEEMRGELDFVFQVMGSVEEDNEDVKMIMIKLYLQCHGNTRELSSGGSSSSSDSSSTSSR